MSPKIPLLPTQKNKNCVCGDPKPLFAIQFTLIQQLV